MAPDGRRIGVIRWPEQAVNIAFGGPELPRKAGYEDAFIEAMPKRTHLLQARGAARTRDLAETLLGKGIKAGFRDQAEIAGQRQFEADAEAIAAAGSNDRLTAARRRSDVPGEARDMLGRGIEKAADLAAARKMLPPSPQYDNVD